MISIVRLWEGIVLLYFFLYNSVQFLLILTAFKRIRYFLNLKSFMNTEGVYNSPLAPSISLLVPAFNEEKTIVASVQSLLEMRYPRFEIIIVSDGSTDQTMKILTRSFGFLRQNVDYKSAVPTARVRATFEAETHSECVQRLILIDKENAGKADALNCALNASKGDFVCSMDADSIMNRNTLLQIVQPMIESPAACFACGGQVGMANGSTFERGELIHLGLSRKPLVLFQVVEYMRSFTLGRTALAYWNSLLILSGVFAVFQRDLLLEVGGFLTKRLDSKIAKEYGAGRETVCEDMEIVVRLNRYVREKGLPHCLMFLPYPITWSQVPEEIADFGRQRNRWFRGLSQVLWIHRSLMANPRYGSIGLIAMPYQFLFEFLGPLVEFAGYLTIPIFYVLGLLRLDVFILFLILSVGLSMVQNAFAVLTGFWAEKSMSARSLFEYQGFKNASLLFLFAILTPLGYRQLQLLYQAQGFVDFLRGRQEWMKFKRTEFETV